MFRSFALRVCSKQWNSNSDTLLTALTVPTLSSRRKTQKLCTLFSILTGNPHCPTPRNTHYSSRHLNSVQLTIPHCRTNSYKHSFSVDTPKLWNSLPFDVATINSVTALKHKLHDQCSAVVVNNLIYLCINLIYLCIVMSHMVTRFILAIIHTAIFLYDLCRCTNLKKKVVPKYLDAQCSKQ